LFVKLAVVQDVVSLHSPDASQPRFNALLRRFAWPTLTEWMLASGAFMLLILAFPGFELWPLAWVGLAPLLVAVWRARERSSGAFLFGWLSSAFFFLGSCWWVTYSIVNYGGIPTIIAYLLLVPGALVLGMFPGICCWLIARLCARWGANALLFAPFAWASLEWARLEITGQLWNAIGYSQAYVAPLIQTARWGGVYAVGFLIVAVNAAIAFAAIKRTKKTFALSASILLAIALTIFSADRLSKVPTSQIPSALIVAVQPNVSVNFARPAAEERMLMERHVNLSESALAAWEGDRRREIDEAMRSGDEAGRTRAEQLLNLPRIVVWPESPMNFTYARSLGFQREVAEFTNRNRASLLFNSLQPAPAQGGYNSAVMVNEAGRVVAQYDKIRLLPFGEYVPIPRWLPGASLVPAMVGDFTPGADYEILNFGDARGGVFICFESAFPEVTREFARGGADVLVNLTNDGYLGPTPVMRQHLANTVFRAVETDRPVLRVTNTGISAFITPRGEVREATGAFEPDVRTWIIGRARNETTFYARRGDLFAIACAALSLMAFVTTLKFFNRRRTTA
jgi:apolipoprotein N-acyltransferase